MEILIETWLIIFLAIAIDATNKSRFGSFGFLNHA